MKSKKAEFRIIDKIRSVIVTIFYITVPLVALVAVSFVVYQLIRISWVEFGIISTILTIIFILALIIGMGRTYQIYLKNKLPDE